MWKHRELSHLEEERLTERGRVPQRNRSIVGTWHQEVCCLMKLNRNIYSHLSFFICLNSETVCLCVKAGFWPSAEKLQELTLPSWPLCRDVPPRERNPPAWRSHSFRLLSHDAVHRKCPLLVKQQSETTLLWLLRVTQTTTTTVSWSGWRRECRLYQLMTR